MRTAGADPARVGPEGGSARMRRLADKTRDAPFFAEAAVLHRVERFRPQDFFDIVAVVSGKGWQILHTPAGERRRRALSAGRIVLYRPVDDVMIAASDPGGILVRYVSFPAGEWTSFAQFVGLDPSWMTAPEPPSAVFDPADLDALLPFDAAIERYDNGATALDLVRFWIDTIPRLFPASHPRFAGNGSPAWLHEAVEAMRDEANLRGGVRRLLELAHVTASHLSTTTRRYYDRTPTELILELRLRHAAVLLRTSADSMGTIAGRCGFGTSSHFSAVFRRVHGQSPREYRARALGRFAPSRR